MLGVIQCVFHFFAIVLCIIPSLSKLHCKALALNHVNINLLMVSELVVRILLFMQRCRKLFRTNSRAEILLYSDGRTVPLVSLLLYKRNDIIEFLYTIDT